MRDLPLLERGYMPVEKEHVGCPGMPVGKVVTLTDIAFKSVGFISGGLYRHHDAARMKGVFEIGPVSLGQAKHPGIEYVIV